MSRTLLLWRHGRTEWNVLGRAQGHSDTRLDDVGVAQAAATASVLARCEPAAVVSSDLHRAVDTAQQLAAVTGLQVSRDVRLREIHYGRREGLTLAEACERFPEQMARARGGEDVAVPGGETRARAAQRFVSALHDVVGALDPGSATVVVSHGGVLRVGAGHFLGLPPQRWSVLGGLDNCHWSCLREGRRGWVVDAWNVGGPAPELAAAAGVGA